MWNSEFLFELMHFDDSKVSLTHCKSDIAFAGHLCSKFQLQRLNLIFNGVKIDRFYCHAITNYIENHSVDKVKKRGYYKR